VEASNYRNEFGIRDKLEFADVFDRRPFQKKIFNYVQMRIEVFLFN